VRFLTGLLRHRFSFGLVQASVSKADARDLLTDEPTPEAPRTIIDVLAQSTTAFSIIGKR
jgi:hypothetical protein